MIYWRELASNTMQGGCGNVFGDKTQVRVVTLKTPVQQLVAEIHGQCAEFPGIGSAVQGRLSKREVLGRAGVPRHCQATRPTYSNRQMTKTEPGGDSKGRLVPDPTGQYCGHRLIGSTSKLRYQMLCLLQNVSAGQAVAGSSTAAAAGCHAHAVSGAFASLHRETNLTNPL